MALKKNVDFDAAHKLKAVGPVLTGKMPVGRAQSDLKAKYLAENDKMLKDAKQIATRVKGVARGGARAAEPWRSTGCWPCSP